MKLTKEDYMRLKKERLAELLVERDNEPTIEFLPAPLPTMPTTPSGFGCDATICTNPHRDCINCLRHYYSSSAPFTTTFNTASAENNDKTKQK